MRKRERTAQLKTKQRPGQKSNILVIGIGNEFRGDDALGLHVARELRGRALEGVSVIEHAGEGLLLVDAWRDRECVIIVDAISSGSIPGTLRYFDASSAGLPQQFLRYSSHSLGVAEAIRLARRLQQLPPRVYVYGIEGHTFGIGTPLSPPVRKHIPELVETIVTRVGALKHELHARVS